MNQQQKAACEKVLGNFAEFDKQNNRPQHLIEDQNGKKVPYFYNEGADRFEFLVHQIGSSKAERYFMFIDHAGNIALAVYELRNVLHLDGSRLTHDEYKETYWS